MAQRATGHDARPLAPAPMPALVGVVALVTLLSVAAGRMENDYFAVASCTAAIITGTIILDRTGRERAEREPHPLYQADKLPSEKTLLKPVLVGATLVALIVVAGFTADATGRSWTALWQSPAGVTVHGTDLVLPPHASCLLR